MVLEIHVIGASLPSYKRQEELLAPGSKIARVSPVSLFMNVHDMLWFFCIPLLTVPHPKKASLHHA
jgi:hypothetical protein